MSLHSSRSTILIRKLIHFLLSLLLLIPILPIFKAYLVHVDRMGITDPVLLVYVLLTFIVALFNSIQIRVPNFRYILTKHFDEFRRKILALLTPAQSKELSRYIEEFDKFVTKAEESLNIMIDAIERDYEKRYGYVCITFAVLSTTLSYALFKNYVFYGILALAIVDSMSAILSSLIPRPRFLKHSIPSILITLIVFFIVLLMITLDVLSSFIIALISIVVELLSPEDNLTLPFIPSLIAWLLHVPIPIT